MTDIGDESEPESDTELDDTQVRQLHEPEADAPTTSVTEYAVYETSLEQLKARIYKEHLTELHIDIKARAQIPTTPAYNKFACT